MQEKLEKLHFSKITFSFAGTKNLKMLLENDILKMRLGERHISIFSFSSAFGDRDVKLKFFMSCLF